jgi:Ca-activated chloride channel family protein
MGVGLDYNENLMVALSESGGGNYYFIESPHGLAHIMRREFDMLSTLYARHASIEIHLGAHIRVSDVIGHEWHGNEETCSIELGDLYGGDNREITVELEVPRGKGSVRVAEGVLQHKGDASVDVRLASFAATADYSNDKNEVEKGRDMDIQAKADVAISTRAVDKATQALDEGRADEAKAILGDAEGFLNASAAAPSAGAAGAAVRDNRSACRSTSRCLKRRRTGGARRKRFSTGTTRRRRRSNLNAGPIVI